MRKLKYVEQKLLKKVNLVDFKNEKRYRINNIISKFGLNGSEEYNSYNSICLEIQKLAGLLDKLPNDSIVKTNIMNNLIKKLSRIGIIEVEASLDVLKKLSVSRFCSRRLTTVLVQLKFAQHMKNAIDLVQHGHIRILTDVVRRPDMIIPKYMEKNINWSCNSKYRRAIQNFKDTLDDFDLLNI